MGNAYVLTLDPTFTQGLIIGQLSILFLLFFILKYLFFDFATEQNPNFSYQPRLVINEDDDILDGVRDKPRRGTDIPDSLNGDIPLESTDWLNVVLQQVCLCPLPFHCFLQQNLLSELGPRCISYETAGSPTWA